MSTVVHRNWEIIVVNDGSRDNTKAVVEGLSKNDKRVRVINHEKNLGYGSSLRTGFYNSKYSWISFIDSDGQFDFSEISRFIENCSVMSSSRIGCKLSKQFSVSSKYSLDDRTS